MYIFSDLDVLYILFRIKRILSEIYITIYSIMNITQKYYNF